MKKREIHKIKKAHYLSEASYLTFVVSPKTKIARQILSMRTIIGNPISIHFAFIMFSINFFIRK